MKQVHRIAIMSALATAGLLTSNFAFGASDYSQFSEHKVKEKYSKQLTERQNINKHRDFDDEDDE